MTEHSIELLKEESLFCATCQKLFTGVTMQLIADPKDDERIGEVLCRECSDKRGE